MSTIATKDLHDEVRELTDEEMDRIKGGAGPDSGGFDTMHETIMQVRSLIATAFALAALAAGGTAFAQSAPTGQEGGQIDTFTSTTTRDMVNAELVQFSAQYPTSPWSFRYDPLANFKSTQTRAEVTAAYVADRDEVAALTGEDSGSAFLAQAASRAAPANANLASTGNNAQVR